VEAEVAAMFGSSDGFPAPATVVGMGLAVRSPRVEPGERTAEPFLPESVVVRIVAGMDPVVAEDAEPPRDYPGRKARHTVRIGCALMLA